MQVPSYFFIANWKMQRSFTESVQWVEEYADQLASLETKNQIVICPTFPALYPLAQKFDTTPIAIGGQNCSPYEQGAYTGQVSAQSIAQTGSVFCIVGHSEQRILMQETNYEVALQAEQVLKAGLYPIVCVGETEEEHASGLTSSIIEEQLLPILERTKQFEDRLVLIAYEPVWAIGTGKMPAPASIEMVLEQIINLTKKMSPGVQYHLIYGGSVKSDTIESLRPIKGLGGFLIGSASLNFQELKKIVLSFK